MNDDDKRADDQSIKVTDKRMFTPDGELREEYRQLLDEERRKKKDSPEPRRDTGPSPAPPSRPAQGPGTVAGPTGAPASDPRRVPPGKRRAAADDEPLSASFQDLVGLLAQSASVYLNQAQQRLETRAEHLELARMHVDLLKVVERKTAGNLDARESAMLEDALRQLRMMLAQVG